MDSIQNTVLRKVDFIYKYNIYIIYLYINIIEIVLVIYVNIYIC